MDQVLQKLLESLADGNILLIPVLIVVGIIINGKKLVEFWEERRQARKVRIIEALQSELIVGATKVHLEAELVNEHFKLITGLSLETEFREALLAAHSKCRGEVKFLHFRRALPHLVYRKLGLKLLVSFWDKLFGLANLMVGLFLVLFSMLLLFIIWQIPEITVVKVLYVLSLSVLSFCFGVFFASQSSSVYSAKLIAPYIKSHEWGFSPAVECRGFVFVSGCTGTMQNGTISDSLTAQTREAFARIKIVLNEAGVEFSDIVDMTTYHVGLQKHLKEFIAVKNEYLSYPYPAWTAIGVSELASEGAMVEIKVVAKHKIT